jgi:hypothetical protein
MSQSPTFTRSAGNMFPFDLDMDFFLGSDPPSSQHVPEEQHILQDTTSYDDRQLVQGIMGPPPPTFNYTFSPFRMEEVEGSPHDREMPPLHESWPMLEKDKHLTPFTGKMSNTIGYVS